VLSFVTSAAAVTTGATLSTVTVAVSVAAFPALSVTVTITVCVPSRTAFGTSALQVPSTVFSTPAKVWEPRVTLTPATPFASDSVPLSTGVESLVSTSTTEIPGGVTSYVTPVSNAVEAEFPFPPALCAASAGMLTTTTPLPVIPETAMV